MKFLKRWFAKPCDPMQDYLDGKPQDESRRRMFQLAAATAIAGATVELPKGVKADAVKIAARPDAYALYMPPLDERDKIYSSVSAPPRNTMFTVYSSVEIFNRQMRPIHFQRKA